MKKLRNILVELLRCFCFGDDVARPRHLRHSSRDKWIKSCDRMAERWACIFFALSLIFCFKICLSTYKIDDRLGYGRRFDGIGAISGGGVRNSCT